ncbi:hypothetical protein [Saccharothrix sp. HUAS TT1]|uniref:hypothetical protein n=1 Tax=unclassified Saccharothrix TaxID=2593673 RepID=UPI00345BFB4A
MELKTWQVVGAFVASLLVAVAVAVGLVLVVYAYSPATATGVLCKGGMTVTESEGWSYAACVHRR